MTLEEARSSDKVMLTPAEVASIIHCDAHALRIMARQNPEALGFKTTVIRSRTLIPREAFLAWLSGRTERVS